MLLPPDILEDFDRDVRKRRGILAPEYRQEFVGTVRRTTGPVALAAHNWIDWFDPSDSGLAEAIDDQVAFYDSIGHAFRWKVYSHDQPATLPDLLLARGFEPGETCALMILNVAGFSLYHPERTDYRRVTDPARLATDLEPIREKVWCEGAEGFIEALKTEMIGMSDHVRIYVAGTGGTTVGCGLIRYNGGKTFGGLFAGATVPEERGRGVYRGMVSARVEDALHSGCRFLYTEAGEMSRPILERLGFEPVATLANFVHDLKT